MSPRVNQAISQLKKQELKTLKPRGSQNLRNLERTSNDNQATDSINFIYTGTGNHQDSSNSPKSRLKHKAPLITAALITILLGGGSLILLAQTIMPTSLAMRIIEDYDVAWVANHARAKLVAKYAVKTNQVSDKMKQDFSDAGIKIDTKNQTFTYTDGNNNTRVTNADEAFDDAIFIDKFTTATESTAGHYSTAYDAITAKVLRRLGISRDVFTDWDNTKDNVDENAKLESIKETIKKRSPELHGQTIAEGESEQHSEDSSISKSSTKEQIKKHLSVTTGALGINAGTKCAKFAVSTALAAHTMESQMATSYPLLSILEAIQKAQAEAGNYSPINQVSNLLTTPDENGQTAMDAPEVQRLYGNTVAAESDYNIEKLTNQASNTVDDLHACTTAATIASGAGILVSVATAGTSSFVKIGTGIIGGALVTIGVQEWLDQYIDDATNTIDKQYAALDTLTGPAVGAGIVNGANSELNAWARAGGSSYMSAEKLASYNKVKEAATEEQAAYERAHLSPFDTSSQYTFLGSLLYNNFAPLAVANHNNSFISVIAQTSTLVSTSFANLLPSASAIAETSVDDELGVCPWLASANNAVGNSDCLPHGGTDPDTLNEDIENVIKHIIAIGGQFESDEFTLTPTIKSHSNLEKQLKICGTIINHPGMYSGAAAEYLHNETAGDSLIDWLATNSIASQTVAGDIAQLIQVANDKDQEGWVNGANCVASDSEYWQTEGKWYQRFLEDQRLLANFKIIEKSAGETVLESN